MVNDNKVVSADAEGITVYFTDTHKHFDYRYERKFFPYYLKKQIVQKNYKGRSYQDPTVYRFSIYQSRLYNDAIYGLNGYTREQLKRMTLAEKTEIHKAYVITKQILLKWKQQLVSDIVDDFIGSWMPANRGMRKLFSQTKGFHDPSLFCPFTFDQLKVTRQDIALKLIQEGILPENFFFKNAA